MINAIFQNNKTKNFQTYPDFDWWTVGNAQPVTVWWEAQSVDAVVVIESVQVFAVVQVPQQGFGVFTAWCAQWTVWWNGDSVQVTVVTFVVDLEFTICQIPYFNSTIPTAWNDDWVWVVWWETHTWNPVRVTFILNCVFAFGQCVPQFDCFVPWTRNDLTIVYAECDWQNILFFVNKIEMKKKIVLVNWKFEF